MLKSIPNFRTILTAPLSSIAAVAEIDQAGADLLRSKLRLGDWMYVALDNGINYEVGKIIGIVGNTVALSRAKDNTTAQDFTAGTTVVYILGIDAVNDVIQDTLLNGMNITGSGIVKVTDNGNGSYNFHADPILLLSGDPDIVVTSVYPNYIITKR